MPIVKLNTPPIIPEGEYVGRIEKVASGFTKSGENQFTYLIRLVDGRTIKYTLRFTENTKWNIIQLFK